MQSPRQNIERWNKAGFKALQILFFCYQSCFPARTHRSEVFCIITVTANTCKYTDKQHMLSRRSRMSLWDTYMSLSLSICLSLCIYVSINGKMGLKYFLSPPTPLFFLFVKPFSSSLSYSLCQLQSMLKQSAHCHILGGKWHWYWTKCKKRLSPSENWLIDVKSNNFKELWWLQIRSERPIPVHSTSCRGCALQFKQQHFDIQGFFIT